MQEILEQAAAELMSSGNLNGRRDAELLLMHVIGRDRVYLISHPDAAVTSQQLALFRKFIDRRKAHEPIHYITGQREFYGLNFEVNPSVLIPRPETEHLVEAALERVPVDLPTTVADIGTGSGAIAVSIAVARPFARITALDISPAALAVANRNATANGVSGQIRFLESDLLSAVQNERFDVIVSNPPYIAEFERGSLEAQVRDYEPPQALFAGATGREIYGRIVPEAARVLHPGGWLLMEIGAGQHLQLQQLLIGWSDVSFIPDLQGIARVVIARAPQV